MRSKIVIQGVIGTDGDYPQAMAPKNNPTAAPLQVPVMEGESAPSKALKLPRQFCESLCPYQRHGVSWLWQLYLRKQGGILADEMGLGKTVLLAGTQVVCFFSRDA